jgi:hypothetical protein
MLIVLIKKIFVNDELFSVEFVRTRLLRNSILANTIIGIIPIHPEEPSKSLENIQKQKTIGSVVTVVQVSEIKSCFINNFLLKVLSFFF